MMDCMKDRKTGEKTGIPKRTQAKNPNQKFPNTTKKR